MSEVDPDNVSSIGDRLKAAREASNMSLAEVSDVTRIPVRHLENIESDQWDALPAATYSIGFTRSYANAVGLNGAEISAELRQLIGANRQIYDTAQSYYEPADPARVPPKSLAIITGAIALALIVGYIIWRSITTNGTEEVGVVITEPAPPPTTASPLVQPSSTPNSAIATGPVVLTATDDVWVRVYEGDSGALIHESILHAGERFEVPATARTPQLHTGRPEALKVMVGATEIPQLGEPEKTISNVSLLPEDLLARTQGRALSSDASTLTPTTTIQQAQ